MVSALAPRIAAVTSRLLDSVRDVGRFDLIEALAHPLPVIVIAELLGIPAADQATFRGWTDAILSIGEQDPQAQLDQATMNRVGAIVRELNGYLLSHIQQRRARPDDGLISRLLAAEVDGSRLDDEEIVGVVGLLLNAGHITTTALLGNAILCLDEHPAAAAERIMKRITDMEPRI
ncbi:uncharacterized protein SOCE26_030840 [Sorangium cellulosum]|uniref:Cytochrome P450 n=1 Tax=Sorangium cellulosum TaxID=56 RepID=A0A2L0EQY0_SORCE|nr:cytochrome P450 [Sorangium cellulosum]AUX41662.1 uncharacterized protein SOCE26_030840 [Sorangium cellulosum]